MVNVWIDDQHPIFRKGIAACLTAHGFEISGESSGFAPAPQLGSLDVLVFEADGRRLGRAVRHVAGTDTKLVGVMHVLAEQALYEAVDAGVAGILTRSEIEPHVLVSTLQTVQAGSATLPAESVPKLLEQAANGAPHRPRSLAPRELAVLELLAGGSDTRGIATELAYSERTVKNIVHDVLMKMNCRNRAHAVAVATRQGII